MFESISKNFCNKYIETNLKSCKGNGCYGDGRWCGRGGSAVRRTYSLNVMKDVSSNLGKPCTKLICALLAPVTSALGKQVSSWGLLASSLAPGSVGDPVSRG